MKQLNQYILEKLKIDKDSRLNEFKPKCGEKGLVLKINSGGFNGQHIADIYPCEIFEIHKNETDFLVSYTNAPKNTTTTFNCVKDKNYVAKDDNGDNLQYYDKEYCLNSIEKMIKNKKYEIDGYLILKPNKFNSINDYLYILQLYLQQE